MDNDENLSESNQENVHAPENSSLDQTIQQLSLDHDADDIDVPPKLLEIQHLEKRIQNVQLSLQTSQGLTNPKIWRTNCLFPVRKAVKEWRSILMYHFAVDTNHATNEGKEEEVGGDEINNHDHRSDLHSTSQQVFGLIQMAMQSGPLVGSNAGYFKRCGGEVASIAFEFLGEIVELAEVEEKIGADCAVGEDGCSGSDQEGACGADLEVTPLENQGEGFKQEFNVNRYINDDSSESEDESRSESGSSSSSTDEDMENLADAPIGATVPEANSPDASFSNMTQVKLINNLQKSLFFTEKQSQRFCQWYRNAEKAMTMNKPPSASATKLQNQKSKKQKQKEQKMERKMKKKKKGGDK